MPPEAEFVAWCARHRDELLAALPDDMGKIANICGFATLLTLVKARAGRRFYVGRKGGTAIAAIVGRTAARHIASLFGGEYINIMSLGSLTVLYRSMQGVEMARAGKSASEICAALGVTRKTAYAYFRRTREPAERAR